MRAAAAQALEDFALTEFVLEQWTAGLDTAEIAKRVRDIIFAADDEPSIPTISQAQAYAYGIISRHQDARHAARQQEAQRA